MAIPPDPHDAEAAQLQSATGRAPEPHGEDLSGIEPRAADDCLVAAWAHYDARQLGDAIAAARQACADGAGRPDCAAALGWFLLEGGRPQDAESVLLSAIAEHPEFPALHWHLGVLRFRQRRLDEALHSLTRALQLDPNLDEAAVSLAWLLHDTGRLAEATAWARKALAAETRTDRQAQLGWFLLLQEEFDEAAALLQAALAQEPERVQVRRNLVSALQHLGRIDEATEVAQRGLALSPEEPDLLLAMGWLHHRRGEAEAAKTVAEQLLRTHPDSASAWHLLGVIWHEAGSRENEKQGVAEVEALHALTRALQLDPNLDDAAASLAWVLHDMGQLAEATGWARKALAAKTRADRQAQLGWLLLLQEEFDEAAALLQAALAQEPERVQVRRNLISALQHLGRLDEATVAAQRGLALSPEEPDLLLALGWLHHRRGETEAAKAVAEQLLRCHPNSTSAWHLLGVTWHEGGNLEKAEQCLAEVQARDESLVDALVSRASILRKMNRHAEAAATLRAALRHAPNDVRAQTELFGILLDQGETQDARRRIHQSLRESPQDGVLWCLLAQTLAQLRRYGIAALALGRARRLAPASPEVWRRTGWLSLELGNLRTAREAVERLLALAPEDPASDILAAVVLEASGNWQSAAQHAEKAVDSAPRSASAWRALAQVRTRQDRLREAEEALHIALDLDPIDTSDAYRQLGWVCHADHRYDDAVAAFTASVENNSKAASSWYGLAEAYRAAGKFVDALRAIHGALRLRDKWPDARALRSQIVSDQIYYFMKRNWQDLRAAPQTLPRSRFSESEARSVRDRGSARVRPRVLVIDIPCAHRANGDVQRRAHLMLLALRGCDVTLFLLSPTVEDRRNVYASIPFSIEIVVDQSEAGLEHFLERHTATYDVAIVRQAPNMALIDSLMARRPDLFRDLRLIYDAEAIAAEDRLEAEVKLARRAATVLADSEIEAAKFRAAGMADVRVLSHSIVLRNPVPGWAPRDGLLFVGDLAPDTPTEDGLIWFVREVFPLLATRLQHTPSLRIVGECRSSKIAALASDNIHLLGRIDDPAPYYDASRVFVAPIRDPSGIPFEIIEAAANGIPVIADKSAARQLSWNADREILVAEDGQSFADAIVRLHNTAALWLAIQQGSQQRTRTEYSPERFDSTLLDAVSPSSHQFAEPGASPGTDTCPFPRANYEYILCSLSTRSHLPLMRTLAASARKHFRGRIHLLLIDSDDSSLIPDGTTLVRLNDVIDPAVWREMVGRYNILELCCVLKPFLMRYLARTADCPIVYLDADTYLLAALDPLLPDRPDFSVFLTPHLFTPLSGERHAEEIGMLRAGVYNAGVVGVGVGDEGIRFLDWWSERVSQYAYDTQEQGVFTDQRWLELVPCLFRNVCVSRDTGMNVGHWRVCSERDFAEDPAGRLTFCGELVTLMHMSGFKSDRPDLLAQNLRPPVTQGSPLGKFLQKYARELIENKWPGK